MKSSSSLAVIALLLAGATAAAQDHGTARPDLMLKEIVQGMPRGEKQEVRVLTATLKPGDRTRSRWRWKGARPS